MGPPTGFTCDLISCSAISFSRSGRCGMLGPRNASKVTRPPFPLIGGWGLGTRLIEGSSLVPVLTSRHFLA